MDDVDFSAIDDVGEEQTRRAHGAGFSGVQLQDAPRMTPQLQTTHAAKQQPMRQAPIFTKGIWSVKPEQVPELPELHPLERTAVFVPDEEPSAISERVSAELRDRSIEAHYEEDYAKAKCTTADGVDFRVRMYRGRGKFNHGIIVEVQRRFGVSTSFHTDATAILDRAKGKQVQRSFQKTSPPLVSDAEDDYQASGSSSLKMVSKMLMQPGYDSQYLGLQTLSSLTDGQKMGMSTAKAIAKELVRSGNEVGSKVFSLILDSKGEDEMFKLRTISMTILANSLHALKGDIPMDLREQLEPSLMQDLRNAEDNQRIALLAAKSVENLLLVDKQNITEYDEALNIALEVGKVRHAGLEKQAQKCLNKML